MWREEKEKRVEADKIIMKKMEEIEQLKAQLAREKEDRQYDNLVHKRELSDLFKGKYDKGK